MKHILTLACTAAAIALALAPASPAEAGLVDARFSGTVDSQVDSAFAVGSAIAGSFVYDTVAARFVSFGIGGESVAPGYASTASVTPDRYSAIYRAQLSPVGLGGNLNSTFSVDLEGIAPWLSGNAVGLLLDASQLANNLDTTFIIFGFYTGNADGTGIHSLDATLNAIRITAVPEPGMVSLLFAGMAVAGLGLARRRR